MRKPTVRKKAEIILTFQMTDERITRLIDLIHSIVEAVKIEPYPREYINPEKGDYIKMRAKVTYKDEAGKSKYLWVVGEASK